MCLGLYPKSCKLYFDTCELLFEMLVAAFHRIVDDILVANTYFKILINPSKVCVENFGDVVQLATDAAG